MAGLSVGPHEIHRLIRLPAGSLMGQIHIAPLLAIFAWVSRLPVLQLGLSLTLRAPGWMEFQVMVLSFNMMLLILMTASRYMSITSRAVQAALPLEFLFISLILIVLETDLIAELID